MTYLGGAQTSLGAAGSMAVVANIRQYVVNGNRRVEEMDGEMQRLRGEVVNLKRQHGLDSSNSS